MVGDGLKKRVNAPLLKAICAPASRMVERSNQRQDA
jgi:hypothetical protein